MSIWFFAAAADGCPEDDETSLVGLETRGMEPHASAGGCDEQDARSGGADAPEPACDGQLVKNEEREVGQVSTHPARGAPSSASYLLLPQRNRRSDDVHSNLAMKFVDRI